MSMQYTSGPWAQGHFEDGRRVVYTVATQEYDCIAELPRGPCDLANACLIASAPDLLEALRALMAAHIDGAGPPVAVGQAWEMARAAITKACGQ